MAANVVDSENKRVMAAGQAAANRRSAVLPRRRGIMKTVVLPPLNAVGPEAPDPVIT